MVLLFIPLVLSISALHINSYFSFNTIINSGYVTFKKVFKDRWDDRGCNKDVGLLKFNNSDLKIFCHQAHSIIQCFFVFLNPLKCRLLNNLFFQGNASNNKHIMSLILVSLQFNWKCLDFWKKSKNLQKCVFCTIYLHNPFDNVVTN